MDQVDAVMPVEAIGHPVRMPKAAELIAEQLRRQIVRGELAPGRALLPEAQLMKQFEVSRPTLREAYRILEAESLIQVRRGARGGAEVTLPESSVAKRNVALILQLRGTGIQDVYEARTVIEPYCAGLLARRRTPGDLADLRRCVAELAELLRESDPRMPDPTRWSALEYRFHELIFERCGNQTLALQCEVLADIVATHLQSSVARHSQRAEAGVSALVESKKWFSGFTDLIEAKNEAGAEASWRKYMEAAGRILFAEGSMEGTVVDLFN